MESTSETTQWKENSSLTSSTVAKTYFQAVSAGQCQVSHDDINVTSSGTMELSLRPIVNSLYSPDDGNVIDTAKMDKLGNEIGQSMQQNQQKESVESSTSFSTINSGSISSSSDEISTAKLSSILQTSKTSVVSGTKETSSSSSSVSYSSYISASKQEIVSASTTRSLSSTKSLQSIQKSAVNVVDEQKS